MRISRDTFIARCRAALGDLPQAEPQPLFAWLAKLEGLLARPPVERREPAPTTKRRWPTGAVLVGALHGWTCAFRVDYIGSCYAIATCLADRPLTGGRWSSNDSGEVPLDPAEQERLRLATKEELAEIAALRPGA